MVSSLARSSPDRAVLVRGLAWGIVLYSWARYFILQCMSPPKCILANLMLGANPAIDKHLIQRVSRNTPSRFMLQNPEISAGLMDHLACILTYAMEKSCACIALYVLPWCPVPHPLDAVQGTDSLGDSCKMKQVSQQGGVGSHCTLIVHELIVYIIIARRLNIMFNLELASFKFKTRIPIRDRQKNVYKRWHFLGLTFDWW